MKKSVNNSPTLWERFRFYWGAFVISFVVAVLMIPAIMVYPQKKGFIMHRLNRLILKLIGARVEASGKLDPDADMIVMNHQGIIDIIGMEALQTHHLRWAAKKELFDATWFGNLLKHGEMISLDRGSKAALVSLLKSVKESRSRLDRIVAIFPEGTRAKGQELLPFKAGTKIVAEKLGLKVQPVVITGSKWVLNEHNKTAHSGVVHYTFLPTLDVSKAEGEWFDKMREEMQKVIDSEEKHHHRSR
jgi:1-acyl-sn-glycerol-3-phosphate acyltransferase